MGWRACAVTCAQPLRLCCLLTLVHPRTGRSGVARLWECRIPRDWGDDGNLPTLAWGQPNGFQTVGFVAFSAGFVLGDTPTVSKALESGGKSSGKFPKTVGVCKDRYGLIHEYSQAC